MGQVPRLLFVHAHPDDESITTGGTIAHYTARGAQVNVVTCTLGEEGEVIGDRWAQLAVGQADQLGGYRIGELSTALHVLGVGEPTFLGGAGRWRDSGMLGTPSRSQQRFIDAAGDEAVDALVAIIRKLRPHVVVTYDPHGGYGHPDHVRTHEVTSAAVAAAGHGGVPGVPWVVPKFYWTVTAISAFEAGRGALTDDDVLAGWSAPVSAGYGYPDDEIDAVVAVADVLPVKAAAMAAHGTQITVGPTGRAYALSDNQALPILGEEHYILVVGSAGDRDARGWETDLLAGLDCGEAARR